MDNLKGKITIHDAVLALEKAEHDFAALWGEVFGRINSEGDDRVLDAAIEVNRRILESGTAVRKLVIASRPRSNAHNG